MAFDLVARLKLIDNMTQPLRRAMNQIERMNNANRNANKSFNQMGRMAGSAFKGIELGASSAVGSLRNIALAVGGATAAYKLFNATIGAAAQYEMSGIQIKAMFQDDNKAKKYMDMIQQMAIKSPLFNSKDMLDNSKTFLAQTQDLKTLEHAWKVAEKLQAWSPEQGVNGVTFAMRELASGDAMSMIERFELPRGIMNQIKTLNFKDQLTALDKLLAKLRITDKYIADIGSAALSQWNQIKEKIEQSFMTMGKDGLAKIKPQLERFNNWLGSESYQKFTAFGSDLIGGLVSSSIGAFNSLKSYIDNDFINNPEFNKLPDLQSKVKFVLEDLLDTFNNWYAEKGSAQIEEMTSETLQFISTAFEKNAAIVTNIGITIGDSLAKGIGKGIKDSLPTVLPALNDGLDSLMDMLPSWVPKPNLKDQPWRKDKKSHAAGLAYVPYNGYSAKLHQGERVLTAQQNRDYSSGSNGLNIAKLADQIVIREDADIDKIARALAKEIKTAGDLSA